MRTMLRRIQESTTDNQTMDLLHAIAFLPIVSHPCPLENFIFFFARLITHFQQPNTGTEFPPGAYLNVATCHGNQKKREVQFALVL